MSERQYTCPCLRCPSCGELKDDDTTHPIDGLAGRFLMKPCPSCGGRGTVDGDRILPNAAFVPIVDRLDDESVTQIVLRRDNGTVWLHRSGDHPAHAEDVTTLLARVLVGDTEGGER